MDTVLLDLRYGARSLWRSPGFTAVAVLSLALGIGANAAIFTLANALLFKPMAVPAGAQLIRANYDQHSPFAYPDYADIRDDVHQVVDLAALRTTSVAIGQGDAVHEAMAEVVTANYWRVVRLALPLGRVFTDEDARIGAGRSVAILSDRLWRREFAGARDVIGQTVTINGNRYDVIGVAPASYHGGLMGQDPELILPISEAGRLAGMDLETRTRGGGLYTLGRMQDGATFAQARAAMNGAATHLATAYPDVHRDMHIAIDHARGAPSEAWPALAVMSAGLQLLVALVLLIACSNVVNVVLARATMREREIAVRSALGASRIRLVRQLVTECALLAASAAGLGLLLGNWAVAAGVRLLPAELPLSAPDVSIDARVLLYTAGIALIVLVLCGVWPALKMSRPSFGLMLRESAAGSDRRQSRMRNGLLIAQVAMCTILLVGSGLFLRSLWRAQVIRPGFDAERVLDVPVDMRMLGLDEARGRAFVASLTARLQSVGAVTSMSMARLVPLSFDNMGLSFTLAGQSVEGRAREAQAGFNVVGPAYFETLGITLVDGRGFVSMDDAQAPFVAVINETMARRYWPGSNAIGQRFGANVWGKDAQVIGVVRDSKYTTLGEPAQPFMYLPFAQHYSSQMVMQLRTNGAPRALLATVRTELHAMAPTASVRNMRPLSEDIRTALLPAKVGAGLLGVFGSLALLLAMGGVFGVVSFSVAQRTREIGIRTALGGSSRDIIRFVLAGSMQRITVGVGIGLLCAAGVGRLMSTLLYGVSAVDPLTFVAVPMVLMIVALGACFIPVRRAVRVNPLLALRSE